MTTPALDVSGLSLPDLALLRQLVLEQRIQLPLTDTGLRAAGFTPFADLLARQLRQLTPDAIVTVLDVAIAERTHHNPPRLRLVWTGPEDGAARARETEAVVCELFEGAQREVLIGGYRFDHGATILAPLHRGMATRGVHTKLFIDIHIEGRPKRTDGWQAYARDAVNLFFQDNWPFGPPYPDIYYDPRTAMAGPPWASLHAKCIVVDARRTFITSANFTQRAQERNVEIGVVIDDERFATEVTGQWLGLIRAGAVEQASRGALQRGL